MPDPVLYTQGMAVAAVVSVLCTLAIGRLRSSAAVSGTKLACTLGLALGLIAGYRCLNVRFAWPPVNGLGRFLTVVLPAVVGIELLACWPRVSPRIIGCLRAAVIVSCGRILLHGSVYLGGPGSQWTMSELLLWLVASSTILGLVWWLMYSLACRSSGTSLLLSIAMGAQAAAIIIMLAGYVTGGAAALPLTAALLGVAIVASQFPSPAATVGAVGIGVVGLFGLLFVGRFFGGLTSVQSLTIFLAPLLCWVTEAPALRRQPPLHRALLRLLLVAIPLMVVLVLAKQAFDRDTAPLLGASGRHESGASASPATCSSSFSATTFSLAV